MYGVERARGMEMHVSRGIEQVSGHGVRMNETVWVCGCSQASRLIRHDEDNRD